MWQENAVPLPTDFYNEHRREFECLREESEKQGADMRSACPKMNSY